MKTIVVATLNPGKVREFAAALIPAGLEVTVPAPVPTLLIVTVRGIKSKVAVQLV